MTQCRFTEAMVAMTEYPVSRFYKNSKLLQIVEGTSEIQRMIIGRILAEKAAIK